MVDTVNVPVKTDEWRDLSIELLNDIFYPLEIEKRLEFLYKYFKANEVLLTSSFGTNSAVLLKLIKDIKPEQVTYFIDTTFHFPETIAYKEQLTSILGITVHDLRPKPEENQLTRDEEWWKSHPRMCCTINKISPLEPIKARHKVWISGLMAYQTAFRSNLRIFEKQGDIIKFHPLIDISEDTFRDYFEKFSLPEHPLEASGYGSIGCTHCTVKGEGREGRWKGTGKTECGLHPGYFVNKLKQAI